MAIPWIAGSSEPAFLSLCCKKGDAAKHNYASLATSSRGEERYTQGRPQQYDSVQAGEDRW